MINLRKCLGWALSIPDVKATLTDKKNAFRSSAVTSVFAENLVLPLVVPYPVAELVLWVKFSKFVLTCSP